MRVIASLGLIPMLFFATLVCAQKSRPARQSASIFGEYREYNPQNPETPWGDTTFNIERKRTRDYRLWIGSMGTSSMNYHQADAKDLQINERTGALSFSYTDEGERCSFSGAIQSGKIEGQLDCTDSSRRDNKQIVLKKYRSSVRQPQIRLPPSLCRPNGNRIIIPPNSPSTGVMAAFIEASPAFNFGFGWFTDTFHGHRIIYHCGVTPGFSSSITRFVDDKLTVIVLTNSSGQIVDQFTREILVATVDRVLRITHRSLPKI